MLTDLTIDTHNPVTARGVFAAVRAAVSVFLVSVITAFSIIEHTITAARKPAIAAAVALVAITVFAIFDTLPQKSVAAAGSNAGVQAAVVIAAVSIITFFTEVDAVVAAAFGEAIRRAAITVRIIPIIAFFKTVFGFKQVIA